jgi:hypothetical protein
LRKAASTKAESTTAESVIRPKQLVRSANIRKNGYSLFCLLLHQRVRQERQISTKLCVTIFSYWTNTTYSIVQYPSSCGTVIETTCKVRKYQKKCPRTIRATVPLISLRLRFRRNFLSVLHLIWRTDRKFLRNLNLNEITLLPVNSLRLKEKSLLPLIW